MAFYVEDVEELFREHAARMTVELEHRALENIKSMTSPPGANQRSCPETSVVRPKLSQDMLRRLSKYDGNEPISSPVTPWLVRMAQMAVIHRWSLPQTHMVAVDLLTGRARKWYESQRDRLGTWHELRAGLESKFGRRRITTPAEIQAVMKARRKLGRETVRAYVRDMESLGRRARLSEKEVRAYILEGIVPDSINLLAQIYNVDREQFITYMQKLERYYCERQAGKVVQLPKLEKPNRGNCKEVAVERVKTFAYSEKSIDINLLREDLWQEISASVDKEMTHYDNKIQFQRKSPVTALGQVALRTHVEGVDYLLNYIVVPKKALANLVVLGKLQPDAASAALAKSL